MALHIIHWKVSGRTLAPLELNEVMYTLELGIVTAGFVFMVAALVATLIFGRFFRSWGCHILALEDLCAWLLAKLRIRPKPIRSRLLLLVPPGAMFYMFVWPQISRLLAGQPAPAMHIRTDSQGWASFLTTNFWRNLPGPGVTVLTFAVVGFAVVTSSARGPFASTAVPTGPSSNSPTASLQAGSSPEATARGAACAPRSASPACASMRKHRPSAGS